MSSESSVRAAQPVQIPPGRGVMSGSPNRTAGVGRVAASATQEAAGSCNLRCRSSPARMQQQKWPERLRQPDKWQLRHCRARKSLERKESHVQEIALHSLAGLQSQGGARGHPQLGLSNGSAHPTAPPNLRGVKLCRLRAPMKTKWMHLTKMRPAKATPHNEPCPVTLCSNNANWRRG